MHLVSYKKGTVTKINHVQEIREMQSVRLLEIEAKIGDQVVKTVNIRTDSGYVLLENGDSMALQADYNRILELQKTMFEVEGELEDVLVKPSEVKLVEAPALPVSKLRRRRRAHTTDQNIATRELRELESFGGQPSQQGNIIQPFEAHSLHLEEKQQQFEVTNSVGSSVLAKLKQKLSKIAVRASAILAGYCVAIYTAAVVLPFIF